MANIPIAQTTPIAGDSPPTPNAAPIRLARPMNTDSATASLMPSGRSSGPSGVSCAWIASVLARERAYPRAIAGSFSSSGADMPLQGAPQRPRGGFGIVGVGDRAHHDDAGRAALDDLVDVGRVEPA